MQVATRLVSAAIEMARSEVGRVKLGSQGLQVSSQGLGCMGMSIGYGLPKPEEEAVELIRHAAGSGHHIFWTHRMKFLIGKVKGSQRILIEFEVFDELEDFVTC